MLTRLAGAGQPCLHTDALKQNLEYIAFVVLRDACAIGCAAAGVKLNLNDCASVTNEHGFALVYTGQIPY